MSVGGQGTKCHRKVAENYNRLSMVHDRSVTDDRQTTDRLATAYSERERSLKVGPIGKKYSILAIGYCNINNLSTLSRITPAMVLNMISLLNTQSRTKFPWVGRQLNLFEGTLKHAVYRLLTENELTGEYAISSDTNPRERTALYINVSFGGL